MDTISKAILEGIREEGEIATHLDEGRIKLLRYLGSHLTHQQMSNILGVSPATFNKFLSREDIKREMDIGKGELHLSVVGKIVSKALDGDNAMLSLYAKTQMGWADTQKVEHIEKAENKTLDDFYNIPTKPAHEDKEE